MEKLKNKDAIRNLIGVNTSLMFVSGIDAVLTYKTTVPKKINEEFYFFTLEVFYTELDAFLCHESCGDLLMKQPFQVFARSMDNQTVHELYYKKFQNPKDN